MSTLTWFDKTLRYLGAFLALMAVTALFLSSNAQANDRVAGNSTSNQTVVTYFYTAGCPGCNEIRARLKKAQQSHQGVKLDFCNLADPKNVDRMNGMYDTFHVPYERWNGRLAVFVNGKCFVNENEVNAGIDAALCVKPHNDVKKAPKDKTSKRIFTSFQALGVGTILIAGLLDGLEPCAMATLVFFVSYITHVGRKQRDIWKIGGMFSLGVFLAYLAIGLGLLRAIQVAQRFEAISRASFGVVGLCAIVLSIVSFQDYLKAKRGAFREMSRQLPGFLKKKTHEVIRLQSRTDAMAWAGFLVGAAVATMELACTGEIYIPTITYLVSVPEYREKAVAYLVAYAAMFSIPLLVIFFCIGMGMRSNRLAEFTKKHTATTKLILSFFFLLIGGLLLAQTARIYGWMG